MTSQYISDIINQECQDFDLIVLKGFSPTLIIELGKEFVLLDDYCIKDNKIVLENINESQFMLSLISYADSRKAICTCESFIKMCTQIAGLDILRKKICVLDNNMLEMYPNPSNMDIPDFDSNDFEDTDSESALYSIYYAFCVCENGEQRIQYIDNYSMSNSCVKRIYIAEPKPYEIEGTVNDTIDYKLISIRDGSLNVVMEELYNNMVLPFVNYIVEAEEIEEERIMTFVQASKMMGQECHIFKVTHDLNIKPRQPIVDVLKRVWGYESFRNLQMYKDLNINHDVIEISQGSIIETVVQQAEQAYYGNKDNVKNVLLTSPTGAGKSLLFQLSAIYLAEKYGLLTLVISPLVALMNDQVEGLKGYDAIATLNSNKTAAEKETILKGVREGTVNILYLAPELL